VRADRNGHRRGGGSREAVGIPVSLDDLFLTNPVA